MECYFGADWEFPYDKKQKGKHLYKLFCPAREASCHETFKCAVSEVLLLWPILRYFVSTVVRPTKTLDKEFASFTALSALIEELQAINVKRGGAAPPTMWQMLFGSI